MKSKVVIVIGMVCLMLQACETMYNVVSPNTPMFNNRNEFQAEGVISTNGYHAKLAYSPIKYTGLLLNSQIFSPGFKFFTESNKHSCVEGALGGYYGINSIIKVEYYIGYGYGTSSYIHPSLDSYYSMLYRFGYYYKFFNQFDLGIEISKKTKLIFVYKYCRLKYRIPVMQPDRWIGNGYNLFYIHEPSLIISHQISNNFSFSCYWNGSYTKWSEINILNNSSSFGLGVKYHIGRQSE